MRIAFPDTFVFNFVLVVIDVASDACDLLAYIYLSRAAEREAKADPDHGSQFAATPRTISNRSCMSVVREVIKVGSTKLFVIASLHTGRVVFLLFDSPWLWFAVQAFRCHKVRELVQYMGSMSADLATDVRYLASFRFCLVLYSVPHWCAAVWWLLAKFQEGGVPLASPSWVSTFVPLTGNPVYDVVDSNDGVRYLLSLYMAWSGLTAMGYAMNLVRLDEICFSILVAAFQIAFNAFVLGTLFHCDRSPRAPSRFIAPSLPAPALPRPASDWPLVSLALAWTAALRQCARSCAGH
jgi:hypothetical protein